MHRDQFRSVDVSRAYVASHIDGRRWTAFGENVVLLQNAPPLRDQLMWLAVLDAGEDAALGSHTSLELAGFKSFSRESTEIHLIIQRGSRATPMPGVRVHESRRLKFDDVVRTRGLPQIDLTHLCRKFGLVAPMRQAQRRNSSGQWRYLDSEWDLPSGEVVVLEVDGRHHLEVVQWQADIKRERSIVISRRWVLRATIFEMRLEAGSVFSDLRAMGVPTLAELSASQRAIAS